MTSLVTDLEAIEILANVRHDEFEIMMYRLQYDDDLTDDFIDHAVSQIAAPIIDAIDCTQCANCCRSLTIQIGQDDVETLSSGTTIPIESIIVNYVDLHQDEDSPHVIGTLRQKPCAFLNGKRCSVYAHRPEACRVYPQFTPDFRWMLTWMLDGASKCPIIYHVLDALHQRLDEIQRQNINNL